MLECHLCCFSIGGKTVGASVWWFHRKYLAPRTTNVRHYVGPQYTSVVLIFRHIQLFSTIHDHNTCNFLNFWVCMSMSCQSARIIQTYSCSSYFFYCCDDRFVLCQMIYFFDVVPLLYICSYIHMICEYLQFCCTSFWHGFVIGLVFLEFALPALGKMRDLRVLAK